MMPPCGSGGGLEKGWPGTSRVGGGPPRSTVSGSNAAAALAGGPAIEETPFGRFLVIADDGVELTPTATRQRPALQARGFQSHQDRDEHVGGENSHAPDTELRQHEVERDHRDDPSDGREPQPVPDQPERTEDHRPDMESVAHEDELVRGAEISAIGGGSVNRIDRHRLYSGASNLAAERTLGGRHLARGARIDRNRRAQRPRQTLEAGFGDMVAVLAI